MKLSTVSIQKTARACSPGGLLYVPKHLRTAVLTDNDLMYHNHGDSLFTLVISGFPGLRQIDYNIFLILPALQVLYPLIQGQTVPLELGGLLIRQSQKVIIKPACQHGIQKLLL